LIAKKEAHPVKKQKHWESNYENGAYSLKSLEPEHPAEKTEAPAPKGSVKKLEPVVAEAMTVEAAKKPSEKKIAAVAPEAHAPHTEAPVETHVN
jgi:hypothetical protein